MSGKPASVGASRAGVAGSPRVLVYVAEQRQLEAGAAGPEPPPARHPPLDTLYLPDNLQPQLALPRSSSYRPHLDRSDQRNSTNAVFYKSFNDSEGKLEVYGAADGVVQRADLCPSSQQCAKENCVKIDNSRNASLGGPIVKRDCADQLGIDFCGVETFNRQLPLETLDATTYPQCTVPGSSDSTMHPMQQVEIRHGQNEFSESVTVLGGDTVNCNDRELSVGKGFVNYQFLEQSVSHQSIVNQSISILNQQVGVNRGIISEGDSGNGPQLVRTADGMVLAVLPAPVISQPSDSAESGSRPAQTECMQSVTVPLGWRRILNGASVLYISPSGTALSTLSQLREYLQTAGTCKCGLPCPLRPETAFSFDPKVVSKPYQVVSGAELTKLCNHKRKLLATLQARSHSPATPPPQNLEQKKVAVNETITLKKKMKKKPGFATNVSVSQLMVQRERSLIESSQDSEPCREVSSGNSIQRGNNAQQSCLSTLQSAQKSIVSQDGDIRQDSHVHRSSHYLTVNSGWISQHQENSDSGHKLSQSSSVAASSSINIGMPVLGTNGQLIGVNTALGKHSSNFKNLSTVPQSNLEQELKEEKKDVTAMQNSQAFNLKQPYKEEESQIFCGLNQPLTPEVMQKINEQQQIFIQQNQKQIEMAMKGFRTQITENTSQNKQNQSQYMPQGQLVIQNGTVVKTNSSKTPPWQVKKNDLSFSNTITSPGPKLQKHENTDYDEVNTTMSEDSSSSYSSFSSNDLAVNQVMCSRVPPLPQHYTMMGQQWPTADTSKKKTKSNKSGKKKNSPTENKVVAFGNNGMRLLQDAKDLACDDLTSNNIPSFMEDPNGYLAQQTVLLNNTISKQVGINTSYDSNQYDNISNHCSNQVEKIKPIVKSIEHSNIFRSNVPNPPNSPTSIPDSSMLSDSIMPQCCKGCNVSMKNNSPEYTDNQMRLKYMKHNVYKMEIDGNHAISSPKHNFEDNPVTSTYIERSPTMNDNCGPIQAGTVSTSNVSLTETLQPPEPSPTLSNSSRNTDTPHSSGSNSSQAQPNCTFPMPSPAYSNSGSCRDNFNSNPPTPGSSQVYAYNSPGPPNSQSITGTQMMHFISNHNVNKNLMEVDNISTMVGVKSGLKSAQDMYRLDSRRRIENSMPGYCPPPHLGGGPAHSLIQTCYVQTFVTTMASGFSVTRDTVTSVLAGKANTATTSINASQANFIRPPPPPSINLATTYAIPNNQPDPFINSVNLPTSYPLHIAGTTAQSMITKSPLEMVQNVIGNLSSKSDGGMTQTTALSQIRKTCPTTPGQILISSTGQIIVSSNQMPPPPPKTTTTTSTIQTSGAVTNVSTSVTQVIPTVGTVQPMVNQPTVVVNTLQTPFVIQPPMVAVDGQCVQQNTMLPQIMTASGLVSGQSSNDNTRQLDVKNHHSFVQGVAMLSPESLKKRNKKKKTQSTSITNVLQIAAPQPNPNNIMVHHTSPQHSSSPQFSPRNFQLSPNNNISPTPMLQALTILPGKSGTPAHIVMNGQGNTNNYGSQQIIANTSPSQQINLLQPVNLLNNASGVMPNFPAFQQFIVPNLGGMMMTADGTAIIQDNSTGMPMQLQLQAVNGQNVLTPMQNPGVFATGPNGGVVLRAQNQQGKIIQSQHSPGAQFLSPNGQVVMNGSNFNGQLSPLLANLSPTGVTFNTTAQVRPSNIQTQEYIQTNQAGQTLMVPLSPKRVSLASAPANRGNSTFVHQNTTIVQQQTTLVANSQGAASVALAAAPHQSHHTAVRSFTDALVTKNKGRTYVEIEESSVASDGPDVHSRHSVSTQTLVNQTSGARGSPPDTTTHSPLGALEPAAPPAPLTPHAPHAPHTPHTPHAPPSRQASPRLCPARCVSTQAHYADTTTESPEPADANSSAMVQCVSSSEQDMAESREHAWSAPRNDFNVDSDTQSMISNITLMRSNRPHNTVESTDIHYNQSMSTSTIMPMASTNYYDRTHTYKRKNEFGDGPMYRSDKIMRGNSYNSVHGLPKEEYDTMGIGGHDKHSRHFPSGSGSELSSLPKLFDRHLGSGDDSKSEDEVEEKPQESERETQMQQSQQTQQRHEFSAGDLVWGPVKGYASWPGKVEARAADGRWSVRWFGADRGVALVHAARLLSLCDGLEAHHAAATAATNTTRHRKSRKLNSLLENAIQEAMAELDKKSEGGIDKPVGEEVHERVNDGTDIMETPKRGKRLEKMRNRDRHQKKSVIKMSPNSNKQTDARLRSSR